MIKKYRWKCRVLLVKTPDYKNQKYKKAKELYQKDIKHFHKRIIKLVSKKTVKIFQLSYMVLTAQKNKHLKILIVEKFLR